SICLNIAEGSARSTDKNLRGLGDLEGFTDKEISISFVFEVASASYRAMDENYITAEEHKALYNQAEILAKRINAFRGKLHPQVIHLLSAICYLLSAICHRLSAIR